MSDELKTAGGRLRAAVEGRTGGPKRQFAEVLAADVVAVGASVPADKQTEVTRALVAGATGANPRNDPELKVHQWADQLEHLADQAGVP